MLSIRGVPSKSCNGVSRRAMLQAAGSGLLGLSLPKTLAAERIQPVEQARAKSVIFMFLFGGPSQFETFDLKPDAPSEIRGPFRPIGCRTPGMKICEHLPRLANVSDHFRVIRSMSHNFNDHSGAGHYLQTGHRWHIPIGGGFSATPNDWPSIGSVVEYLSQQNGGLAAELPNYMVVPNRLGRLQENGQYVRPGEYAGWLGAANNPLTTRFDRKNINDNPYWRNCSDEELNFRFAGLEPMTAIELDRLRQRTSLLKQFDDQRRILDRRHEHELDLLNRRAVGLATSQRTREALDVRREPATTRDQYGRHLFGQATLLARRLVEAGTRFVTIHYDACDGYSWDSHVHSDDVKNHLLPTFDQALSALLVDLKERGLLDETLVVALGEMGRTPKPTPRWGRGHWSTLFPAVVAGAGIPGGTTWGSSDKDGAYPQENVMSPEDLAATIYYALGIDSNLQITMPDGRPTALVTNGQPVRGLFS
ncbi:MAG: DUF1501 domain-containing protein [Planctomycetaceae bacterium]|nr:DUF1501 domain-containing protein [Planctomycetaceae bacterium]